jgi:hypothetical protein
MYIIGRTCSITTGLRIRSKPSQSNLDQWRLGNRADAQVDLQFTREGGLAWHERRPTPHPNQRDHQLQIIGTCDYTHRI